MQVLRHENPLFVPGLSVPQRLSYFATLLGWFDSWRALGYVVLAAATVATGAMPLAAPLVAFVPIYLALFAAQRLALHVLARGWSRADHAVLFEFIRMPASLRATLTLLRSRPRPFVVTVKGRESNQRHRTAMPVLLVALLGMNVAAVVRGAATLAGVTPLHYSEPWVPIGAGFWVLVNSVVIGLAT